MHEDVACLSHQPSTSLFSCSFRYDDRLFVPVAATVVIVACMLLAAVRGAHWYINVVLLAPYVALLWTRYVENQTATVPDTVHTAGSDNGVEEERLVNGSGMEWIPTPVERQAWTGCMTTHVLAT